MKKKALLMGLCAFMTLLVSCSKISEADRIIYVPPVEHDDIDVDYDVPVAPVAQRVLIEEHTGQLCVNCPDATRMIEQFQETYGSRVVPVAIHSAELGVMEPQGLGTELGNRYYQHWNITGKPNGLINRLSDGTSVVLNRTIWPAALKYAIEMTTPLDVRVKFRVSDADASKAIIDVKVLCTQEGASKSGKLQVWVTEDTIVGIQDDLEKGRINDYVHHHVLRATVNGDWGEDVSVSGFGDTKEFHYTLDLKSDWKKEDLSIVAFVYSDERVEQVVRKKIKQ